THAGCGPNPCRVLPAAGSCSNTRNPNIGAVSSSPRLARPTVAGAAATHAGPETLATSIAARGEAVADRGASEPVIAATANPHTMPDATNRSPTAKGTTAPRARWNRRFG